MKVGEPTERELWKLLRPVSFAVKAVEIQGGDVMKIEEYEHQWQTATLPYLKGLNWNKYLKPFLEESISFYEKKKIKLIEEFDVSRTSKSYTDREKIIANTIPALNSLIQDCRIRLQQTPNFPWEPAYADDLKRWGVKKFIKVYLDLFYE